ncbi:glycosyltransferase family 4 protein [Phenylobacterium sp.]|uniref:glycosyltransferase family 4 protein n=1 Tax=Phenylobacterium sp. TaxID=1871053 RepID=UPI0037C7860F
MSETTSAVIRAHADGYDMAKPALMGRQAAGNGFLRAAVYARDGQPIRGLSPNADTARGFEAIVKGIDPAAPFEWIKSAEPERIGATGVLYLADISVATHARARVRTGISAYSLCGVTHTTASQIAMNEIAGLLREAVMPWDALVCTSSAVLETVRRVHEAEADYLRWRHGADTRIEGPQLPVIPLGVHCADFDFSAAQRAGGRAALDLADDEVAALFVGRLVYHAKAHPHAMYRGLQLAAERTGKRVVLILCGWTPSERVEEVFRQGAAQFAPDVRLIFVEGRDPPRRDNAWAAADIFVTLADNIQETFGLTPIEAMAAGLPVVVTDWDGYRDTVRDGVDGFRIATWAPEPGMGTPLARGHEIGVLNYDRYCGFASATTALDLAHLVDALSALIDNPGIRKAMGASGRQRARDLYDWPVIYRQYQTLWSELNARRRFLTRPLAGAPANLSTNLDPFEVFGHYPTHQISATTPLTLTPGATREQLLACLDHPLFGTIPSPRDLTLSVFAAVETGDTTPTAIATRVNYPVSAIGRTLGQLAKMGVVRLG